MRKALSLCLASLALVSCSASPSNERSSSLESSQFETSIPGSEESSSIVVVYFSATGHTKSVAEKIASHLALSPIEIEPKDPYTAEDLNYSSPTSRTSKENADPSCRPEIANSISLDSYSTVFLGYPLWWGEAPKILYTFVESQSFEGKQVYPFCTSASSPIGNSASHLASNTGTWHEGKRFSIGTSQEEINAYLTSLGF